MEAVENDRNNCFNIIGSIFEMIYGFFYIFATSSGESNSIQSMADGDGERGRERGIEAVNLFSVSNFVTCRLQEPNRVCFLSGRRSQHINLFVYIDVVNSILCSSFFFFRFCISSIVLSRVVAFAV